ncbi:unnamed protein product [Polarella glacialis]|uniref:CHK kinase-like domain-containing protein n=1 Tax=Polarella glacialis TaxID=89957 RepID=A0A813ICL8_POLGL|nr:unnamed protein product [Polarella glacialis]
MASDLVPPRPLTAAWLRSCASDAASWPELVEGEVQEQALQVGEEGVNSEVTQLRVLRAGGLERLLIVKRAARGPALGVALFQRWYQRERGFYAELAPWLSALSATAAHNNNNYNNSAALQLPGCVALGLASLGPAAEAFCLVLEQLAPPEWHAAEPARGCSAEEATSAVAALAWLHGCGLAEPARLACSSWLPLTPVHLEYGPQVQAYYAGAWSQVRDELPQGTLSPSAVAMCESLCEGYPMLLRRLAQPPCTLVHGDFRLENLRFKAGAVAAFDWQFCCKARGAYDLAYFLALSLSPIRRREQESQLRRTYTEAVQRLAGKTADAALAELDLDLCVAVLLILASFVMGAATAPEETQEMHWRSLSWLGQAACEWNAGRVLPGGLSGLGSSGFRPEISVGAGF